MYCIFHCCYTHTQKTLSKYTKTLMVTSISRPVVSDALRPHRLYPTSLLCPWQFLGKKTGVGSHSFLQGIFLTQILNLHLLHCGRETQWHPRAGEEEMLQIKQWGRKKIQIPPLLCLFFWLCPQHFGWCPLPSWRTICFMSSPIQMPILPRNTLTDNPEIISNLGTL